MPDATPRLLGLGRALPPDTYTQAALHAVAPWKRTPIVDRLFLSSPVHTRNFFISPAFYDVPRTLTETNRAWREGALSLGGAALREVLADTGTAPEQVDLVAVTSVTGYATPGLDLLLAHQEGLRPDLRRAHFNCIGCHAAVPLLRVAADHVALRPGSRAVALAVEICSACFHPGREAANLVAVSLFGDGAAAAMVGTEGDGPRLLDFGSAYAFEHMDALGFDLTAEGFRIVLDASVPRVVGRYVGDVVDDLLARNGVPRAAVSTWCFHPGGSRILDAVQDALSLPDDAMTASRGVLRDHGNMSSPSVLFVLHRALHDRPPAPGTYGVLAAFGPGLGIEAALLGF